MRHSGSKWGKATPQEHCLDFWVLYVIQGPFPQENPFSKNIFLYYTMWLWNSATVMLNCSSVLFRGSDFKHTEVAFVCRYYRTKEGRGEILHSRYEKQEKMQLKYMELQRSKTSQSSESSLCWKSLWCWILN